MIKWYNHLLFKIEQWCHNRRIKMETKAWKKDGVLLKSQLLSPTYKATLRTEQPKYK